MSRFVVPPSARSWVKVTEGSDFPIQNLPFGLIAPKGRNEAVAVAIGDYALDLLALSEAGLVSEADFPILDSFIELQGESLGVLRRCVFDLLSEDNPRLRDDKKLRERALVPLDKANPQVPIPPNAFVDFYSGIHHASNVGRMFRPDQPPLLPNYRWVPIGYNGRASSVVASGTPILRPKGQRKPPEADAPVFGPSASLDFELEMGFYLAEGSEMGKRITCSAAEDHMLGLVIVNDWSARDFQAWEYQPLGPFLSKSFATTVSPWIVTLDALEPFRIEGMEQDPEPLPHLRPHGRPHFDVELEVWLQSSKMKAPQLVCRSNMKHLYWSMSQQLAHLTSNGTPVEFGDLYASGTISGEEEGSFGSMLELTWRGAKPLQLSETGETRAFLEDGDSVVMRAYAQGDGYRVGFGECRGTIQSAKP
ncbi:MAG: fumarylacetoacetase [Fimbriimonadaceae bacterium]|nr:fumarylacetoacetase [Fimbriimonadaceae bacterium]QYK58184.1 MAG: fumarylacetoacetase [Fimbriimonadaceae bacterium]